MANNVFSGNSEGSIFRGIDGKYYQVINGRDVEVPPERAMIPGLPPGTVGVEAENPFSTMQPQNQSNSNSGLIFLGIGALILYALSRR